jgi:predicted transcriptional regulator
MRVYEVMSKAVETVSQGHGIGGENSNAPKAGRSIGSLVVTAANGKVAGIVTVSDLLDLLRLKPEHRSNRAVRKARGQAEWEDVDG